MFPILFFSLKIALATRDLLWFHKSFYSASSWFCETVIGILIEMTLDLWPLWVVGTFYQHP